MKTKKLLIVLLSLVLAFSTFAVAISAIVSGAGESGSKKINVWLIAGQSNAVGSAETKNYPDELPDAQLLDGGVANVLYYGKGYGNDSEDFVPVRFGFGKNGSHSGPEIGIASALVNSGEKHAIIKYANGDTQLSTIGNSEDPAKNFKTWTPPSARGESEITGTGALYDSFIATVAEAIAKLEAEGYTPVIQGMWWMQGERDGNYGSMTVELYSELLRTLISDVRADVGEIVGTDLSAMPFVYGRILRRADIKPNNAEGLAAVQGAQDAVAADTSLTNVSMIDMRTELYHPETGENTAPVQQDGWHFDTLTQQMMGEAVVRRVYSLMGTGYTAAESVAILKSEQALYSATLNYITGTTEKLTLGNNELFSISDSGMRILGTKVNGTYIGGDYTVYVCINPSQNMTMVEVTLPGGGIVRKGTYGKTSGSAITVSAANRERVKDVSLTYENLVLNEYEIVTAEPMAEGFGKYVYNLVTSFTDATSSRHFAWTANASFIGTNEMAIKYRVKGTSEWTVVTANKLDEPTPYEPEDYFKADVYTLTPNTVYEYKIGINGSSDEVNEWSKTYTFTTAKGDEKEFTFIAVGDTQGITWNGTTSATKGFMYAKAAYDEALEEVKSPAFILHTGDVVEEGLKEEQWNFYFKALGEAGATVPHFAAVGNHDYNLNSSDKNFYFGMHFNHPDNGGKDSLDTGASGSITDTWGKLVAEATDETFYSYNYGDVHFIVYNSGAYASFDELIMKAQRAWLKADLEANKDAKWTVVMCHEPIYHRFGGAYNRNTLADILEGFDVDLVISGHSHLVTRSYPMKNGEIVTKENPDRIVKGTGTVNLLIGATAYNHDGLTYQDYDFNLENQAVVVSNASTLPTYAVFNVTENAIEVQVKQVDGLVVDSFSIVDEQKPEAEDEKLTYTDDFHYFTYADLAALGLWETENSEYFPSAKAPGFSAQRLKLTDSNSVQFNWLKYIGGAENYDPNKTYVFEIDVQIASLGDGSGSGQQRALYVAFGGNYNQIGLDVKTNLTSKNTQVGDGPSHQYAYTGSDTFRIRIAWCGTTTYCTLTDSNGNVLSGSRNQSYYTSVETDPTLHNMVFRCEDGEVYLDNFKFEVQSGLEIEGYGTLPLNYADANVYPIVLFQNGQFKSAYTKTQFTEALAAAKNLVLNTGDATAQLLLRGDAEALTRDQNLGQAAATIDVNLNGYTLTGSNGNELFFLRTKTYSADPQTFTFNVYGGNIIISTRLFDLGTQSNSASYSQYKSAVINFTNVNIEMQRGTGVQNLLANYSYGGLIADKNVNYSITFEDCVFDLSRATTNNILFNNANDAGSGTTYSALTTVIKGGEIILSANAAGTKLYDLNGVSSFTLSEGKDGYTKVTVYNYAEPTVLTRAPLTIGGKAAVLVKASADEYYTTYTLLEEGAEGVYIEGYGAIPAAYADANTYPIVIFQNGEFKAAFKKDEFNTALAYPRNSLGLKDDTDPAPARILLRGDATVTTEDQNLGQTAGVIDINLNGFTLTQTHSSFLFYTRSKTVNNFAQKFTLNVYDGNIVLGGKFFAVAAQNGGTTTGPLKDVEINFTNLNVSLSAPMGTNTWFVVSETGTVSGTSDTLSKFDISITDCVIDLSKLNKANQLFQLNAAYTEIDFSINGGELIVGPGGGEGTNPWRTALYTLGSNGAASFGKGSDGKYLTITAHTDINTYISKGNPTILDRTDYYTDTGDKAVFVNPVTVGEYVSYSLQTDAYIDGYGTVPAEKADANAYPIVIFKDGEFVAAYTESEFTAAMSKARDLVYASEGTARLLLRGDASASANDQNLGAAIGTIDVNLNGFTLTQTDSTQLFFARTKTYSAEEQSFTLNVYGGEIVLRGSLFTLGTQSNGTYNQYKSASINFTDVKITVPRGVERTDFMNAFSNGSLPMEMPVYYTIAFNDCVFDVSGMVKATNVFNFASTSTTTPTAATVTVNGGEVILGNNTASSTLVTTNEHSSVTFGKGSDGKYTVLTVSKYVSGSAVDTRVVTDSGAECIFVKASEGENTVSYALYPEVMKSFAIKTSVTLYSSFVYNIYVPVSDVVNGIMIDGVLLEATEYASEYVTLEDGEYLKISVPLPAAQSLRDVNVTVILNSGTSTVNASWSVNVLKYASKVIGSNYSETEKQLCRDMLSYARAAYEYFGNTGENEKLAQIENILGVNYDTENAPDMSAEAKLPAAGTGFKSATLKLGDTPAFIFYLDDGFDINDFTFTTRGMNVEVKEGSDKNGAYLEVVMYGYRMCDDVTYTVTVNGTTYKESYNIYSYYNYVISEYPENTALHNVVARLAAYAKSADAYRESVTK